LRIVVSTIHNADKILVLEGGTIAELGSHQELLARDGCYAALISTQMEPNGAGAASRAASGWKNIPLSGVLAADLMAKLPLQMSGEARAAPANNSRP
jgi:hypothetical protein